MRTIKLLVDTMVQKAQRQLPDVSGHPEIARYQEQIPTALHDILLPEDDQLDSFQKAVKQLRRTEKERSYVMDLQRRFRLPLRPNETVKKTMIRARLKLLRLTRERGQNPPDALPSDPLE